MIPVSGGCRSRRCRQAPLRDTLALSAGGSLFHWILPGRRIRSISRSFSPSHPRKISHEQPRTRQQRYQPADPGCCRIRCRSGNCVCEFDQTLTAILTVVGIVASPEMGESPAVANLLFACRTLLIGAFHNAVALYRETVREQL